MAFDDVGAHARLAAQTPSALAGTVLRAGLPPGGRHGQASGLGSGGGKDSSLSAGGGSAPAFSGVRRILPPTLTFHCVADVESILSARSLTGLGWGIRFLGSQGTGELYVPGIRGCMPLPRGPKGEYMLLLVVQDPRLPRGERPGPPGPAHLPFPGGLER